MKKIRLLASMVLSVCLLSNWALGQDSYPPEPGTGANPFGPETRSSDFYQQSTEDKSDDEKFCPEYQVKPLSSVQASMKLGSGLLPPDCSRQLFQDKRMGEPKFATIRTVHWRPTNFFHQPLYFDDQPLERYGQSICPTLQPIISGAKFFGTLPILPYKMGLNPYCECVSTLGYYRPGSCAPCVRQTLPWEHDAALMQTAAVLTAVFAL